MPASTGQTLNMVVDQRFLRASDGSVWTHTPPDYSFLRQALEVFSRVRVIARTTDVDQCPKHARRLDGPDVELVAVPSYVGPFQYLRRRSSIASLIPQIAKLDGAFLLRIPSQTAFLVAAQLERNRRRFAVELLTDPHDFFAPGVSSHGLAYLFRPYFCHQSRLLCSKAEAVNFITGSKTRSTHPTPAARWVGGVSDVDLPAEAFLPLRKQRQPGPIRVISVGFLDLLYKGQDLLVRAAANLHRQGIEMELTFAGGGENASFLLNLADALGIQGKVRVTGPLGGAQQVRELLGQSDLFALPSRAEGIPRALLEAMAAGLPALVSEAGAMPDLVESQWVVPAGDEAALTRKLVELCQSSERWFEVGCRNQGVAEAYERSRLLPQRREFYESIRDHCALSTSREFISNVA